MVKENWGGENKNDSNKKMLKQNVLKKYFKNNYLTLNLLIIFMAELATKIVPLVLFQNNCHLLDPATIHHVYQSCVSVNRPL